MIPGLETQHTGNQDVELLQQNIKKFAKVLEDNPLLDGRLLEDVALNAAANTDINHGLGRVPRGWILTDQSAAATVYRVAWTTTTLTLLASGATTVDIWVF